MPVTINGSGPVTGVTAITGAGLDLITTQTFSAASAVNVDAVFSSTYDNYKIVVTGTLASGIQRVRFALRASGTTATTNMESIAAETTSAGVSAKSQATGDIGNAAVDGFAISLDVFGPNLSSITTAVTSNAARQAGVNFWNWNGSWIHTTASAYTGFALTPASSTITGSVSVYGYRKV